MFFLLYLSLSSVLLKSDERHEFEDEDALAEDEGEKSGDNPATSGSRGTAYGGGNELFQSQFQLHTVQQKLNQIVLLQVETISTNWTYFNQITVSIFSILHII